MTLNYARLDGTYILYREDDRRRRIPLLMSHEIAVLIEPES